MYFGTHDGEVMVMDVTRDGIQFDPPDPDNNGVPISFSLLTSYQNYESPGQFKQGQMVRPDFLGVSRPSFETRILYEYSLEEVTIQTTPLDPIGDVWNIGLWEEAVWDNDTPFGVHRLRGVGGIGRRIAVALAGDAQEELRLISFDVMWTDGGPI